MREGEYTPYWVNMAHSTHHAVGHLGGAQLGAPGRAPRLELPEHLPCIIYYAPPHHTGQGRGQPSATQDRKHTGTVGFEREGSPSPGHDLAGREQGDGIARLMIVYNESYVMRLALVLVLDLLQYYASWTACVSHAPRPSYGRAEGQT